MATRLSSAPQIYKLARDLGLKGHEDPVSLILKYCERRVKEFLRDCSSCEDLCGLLDWLAAKLNTTFEVVHTDVELLAIKNKYLRRGERSFARLEDELRDDVYGITFRLKQREPWEPMFVSIIDCRGRKAARAYFTKWHELAHLLVQTDQMRLSFRRTHCPSGTQDAEEALMEVIAGNFGFYRPIVSRHAKGHISFETIEELRARLCPEASQQASLIGFVKAWPQPCLLVRAELALRRNEEAQRFQKTLDFVEVPVPALRAIHVTPNQAARDIGLTIFENMRVPERSVIHKVFDAEVSSAEAEEDLAWWRASNGTQLTRRRVRVIAKRVRDSVQALIVPL